MSAAAIPLTQWLDHLRVHLPAAREGRDPEGVHQVRVATRRLAAWLALRGTAVLVADLRWLRAHAGTVRDLDVLLVGGPPAAWARWLSAQRRRARKALLAALDEPRLAGLLEALSQLPPLDHAEARGRIAKLARRALAAAAEAEDAPGDLDRLHQLRRSLRKLRYALEWLGDDPAQLSELQEGLGALGDAAVALRLLDEFPGAGALSELRGQLSAKLDQARAAALAAWRAHRKGVEAMA